MNFLIKNISTHLIRNQRQLLMQCSRFATDAKFIEELTKKNKVVVFMKGVPDAPRCGFSNAVVQILNMHDVKFDAHDVLSDEELRQGIKDFTSWPTIPQVFINGEFIGGCDILLQMHKDGSLIETLWKNAGIKSALAEDESLGGDDKK
ncbi:hypothetical protein PVAND_003897 [Polypedilum vanderplanki]|uniref:Glutaredoxin-related protein 5, mitochondrial n=1 Tax=Polypedilum vanderplanki TaxID=319348 RepID=A0A9J6BXD4_POLVA|nr:hypothetical protein PVAND_003897 [Polypedilum vanderplanki]